jgi:hypothetical protein
MEYLEAWGTLIHEKNLKSKISCQTPFKAKNRHEGHNLISATVSTQKESSEKQNKITKTI